MHMSAIDYAEINGRRPGQSGPVYKIYSTKLWAQFQNAKSFYCTFADFPGGSINAVVRHVSFPQITFLAIYMLPSKHLLRINASRPRVQVQWVHPPDCDFNNFRHNIITRTIIVIGLNVQNISICNTC